MFVFTGLTKSSRNFRLRRNVNQTLNAAANSTIDVSVAVTFVLFGKASAVAWRLIRRLRQSHQHYTVSGCWIGTCVLPSAPVSLCRGTGVFRGSIMSAVYYTPASDTYESGVLALRLKGRRLVGSYAQFDPNDLDESFFTSDTTYCLTRIQLPLRQSVRMLFGLAPVPA